MAEIETTDLRSVVTFAEASDADLVALARAMTVETLGPGDVLLTHGPVSDQVHVILSGSLAAELPTGQGTRRVAGFDEGEVISEITAPTGEPRTATVVALSSARVGHISAITSTRLLEAAPGVGRQLAAVAHGRLRRNRLTSLLTTIFPPVPDDALAALIGGVEWIPLHAGEALIHDGTPRKRPTS